MLRWAILLGLFSFLSSAQLLENVPFHLEIVDPSLTCMVKRKLYKKKQDKVLVGGKTYYACCAPCKKALLQDSNSHFALDPVTGEKIDKSQAVLAADAQKRVYFFKDKKTFQRHLEKGKAGVAESPAE